MSERGEAHLQTIMDALACPECAYDLRGLSGETVTCPECGRHVHVANYVAAQWRKSWQSAPLYNLLATPLAWVTGMVILTLVVAANGEREWFSPVMLIGMVIMMLGWIPILLHVVRRYGSPEGLWLALLVHITLPAYIFGFAFFAGGALGVMSVFGRARVAVMSPLLLAVGGVIAICLAYAIERFVAKRCIRRHLRLGAGLHPPTSAVSDARVADVSNEPVDARAHHPVA